MARKLPKAIQRPPSALEALLELHLKAAKINGYVREHRFAINRRWRFDFCWPAQRLAVECEGGTFAGGRHTRGSGFESDAEKYNAAVLAGWRVLRYTAAGIRSGAALRDIQAALAVA